MRLREEKESRDLLNSLPTFGADDEAAPQGLLWAMSADEEWDPEAADEQYAAQISDPDVRRVDAKLKHAHRTTDSLGRKNGYLVQLLHQNQEHNQALVEKMQKLATTAENAQAAYRNAMVKLNALGVNAFHHANAILYSVLIPFTSRNLQKRI